MKLVSKDIDTQRNILFSIKEIFTFDNLLKMILTLTGFSLSLNWFLVWRPVQSYFQGVFLDYWAPKLFVSQILIILSLLLSFSLQKTDAARWQASLSRQFGHKRKRVTIFLATLLVSLAASLLFSAWPFASLVWWSQTLLGPACLAIVLTFPRNSRSVKAGVLAGLSMQAGLALFQYSTQQSLGGFLFFGQPNFSAASQLATSSLLPWVHSLPYGATPHPNILAGWLALGILLLASSRKQVWQIPLASLLLLALLITESFSGLLFLLLGLLLLAHPPRRWAAPLAISLVLALSFLPLAMKAYPAWAESASVWRRTVLLDIGARALQERSWGWGPLQSVTTSFTDTSAWKLGTFRQPIHNTALLGVIELGVWTTFLISVFFIIEQRKYTRLFLTLAALSPVIGLDHYLLTTISGQYMVVIAIAFLFGYRR